MGMFADLVAEEQIGRVVLGIEGAVGASFLEDRSRLTGDEIRRRFDVCARIIKTLRGELGWALARVLDHLPRYLRCELDGIPWSPDADRVLWAPPTPTNPVSLTEKNE
jgi:hypothetical protein